MEHGGESGWLGPCFWGNEMQPERGLGVNNHAKSRFRTTHLESANDGTVVEVNVMEANSMYFIFYFPY